MHHNNVHDRLQTLAQPKAFFKTRMSRTNRMNRTNTSFQRARRLIGEHRSIEWVRTRYHRPQGLVFIPPLIGGDLCQQISDFRWLIKQHYDLVSFNYSGHGKSTNLFSIGASLRDTQHMLSYTGSAATREAVPLFGIASCYGAIPLLSAVHRLKQSLAGIVLINAVPGFFPEVMLTAFLSHYRQAFYRRNTFTGFPAALKQYTDRLFPGITKGKDHFGTLKRRRAALAKIIFEFLTLEPLEGVRVDDIPVLCLHAQKDSILNIYNDYRQNIRAVCPQARFHCLKADHFLSHAKVRREATHLISNFLCSPHS